MIASWSSMLICPWNLCSTAAAAILLGFKKSNSFLKVGGLSTWPKTAHSTRIYNKCNGIGRSDQWPRSAEIEHYPGYFNLLLLSFAISLSDDSERDHSY
jgi:hypothetical protein